MLVARYGGEEFALLLPGLDLAAEPSLAEEARKSIEDLLITHAEAPCGYVTISIGVESLVPAEGPTGGRSGRGGGQRALRRETARPQHRGRAALPLLVSIAS